MQLSRNFSLQELTKSDTAIRKGIDNNPNADQIEKLKGLCENILFLFFSICFLNLITAALDSPGDNKAVSVDVNPVA